MIIKLFKCDSHCTLGLCAQLTYLLLLLLLLPDLVQLLSISHQIFSKYQWSLLLAPWHAALMQSAHGKQHLPCSPFFMFWSCVIHSRATDEILENHFLLIWCSTSWTQYELITYLMLIFIITYLVLISVRTFWDKSRKLKSLPPTKSSRSCLFCQEQVGASWDMLTVTTWSSECTLCAPDWVMRAASLFPCKLRIFCTSCS